MQYQNNKTQRNKQTNIQQVARIAWANITMQDMDKLAAVSGRGLIDYAIQGDTKTMQILKVSV